VREEKTSLDTRKESSVQPGLNGFGNKYWCLSGKKKKKPKFNVNFYKIKSKMGHW
jgi:hypothetical protein